jgi:hypothetical protein
MTEATKTTTKQTKYEIECCSKRCREAIVSVKINYNLLINDATVSTLEK